MDEENRVPGSAAATDYARVLASAATFIHTLPDVERKIASLAARGAPIWEIASETRLSEAAVWRTLDGIVASLTGRPIDPVETGGLGADTDPGVTGGYGNTGFGALDTEPIPDNTEPEEG